MATINLSEATQERLHKMASLHGMDMDTFAESILSTSLEAQAEEFQETCAAIARGLAEIETGDTISFEDYVAQTRAARDARKAKESIGTGK
jgi:predicted transcriptional regulator